MLKTEKKEIQLTQSGKKRRRSPKDSGKMRNWKEMGESGGAWSQWEEGRAAEESIPTNPWHTQQLAGSQTSHSSIPLFLFLFSSLRACPTSPLFSKASQIIHCIIFNPKSLRRFPERLTHGNLAKPTTWTFTYPSPKPKKLSVV
jgi:hypothetical protein